MNPRMTGKITKKYFGEPKTNPKGFWYRLDAVYVQEAGAEKGIRMSYFSNPPKDNPSAEAIEDRYPECVEGMIVDVEYKQNGQYFNIEDMQPHGSTLPANDPVARMTAPKPTPAHLQPGPTPEEPLPALPASMTGVPTAPAQAPTTHREGGLNHVPDEKDWRIARSVAVKEVDMAATGGMLPALAQTWGLPKETEIAAVARVIARFIVNG